MNKSVFKERKRASAVCIHDNKLLIVYLEDPTTKVTRPFVPGGEIENGESPEQAATRETLEETGYEVTVDTESTHLSEYLFLWDGITYECETYIFKATLTKEYTPPGPVDDVTYHRGVSWMPLEEFESEFSYHSEIQDSLRRLIWPK